MTTRAPCAQAGQNANRAARDDRSSIGSGIDETRRIGAPVHLPCPASDFDARLGRDEPINTSGFATAVASWWSRRRSVGRGLTLPDSGYRWDLLDRRSRPEVTRGARLVPDGVHRELLGASVLNHGVSFTAV